MSTMLENEINVNGVILTPNMAEYWHHIHPTWTKFYCAAAANIYVNWDEQTNPYALSDDL